jgi:hypothetical protein
MTNSLLYTIKKYKAVKVARASQSQPMNNRVNVCMLSTISVKNTQTVSLGYTCSTIYCPSGINIFQILLYCYY